MGRSSRYYASSRSYSTGAPSMCQGVCTDWSQCGEVLGYAGSFCSRHFSQSRWHNARRIPNDEFEQHYKDNLCCGLVQGDYRLCRNRVAGGYRTLSFCWRHGDQRPPPTTLPSKSHASNSSVQTPNSKTYQELKELFLRIVELGTPRQNASGQRSSRRSSSGSDYGHSYNQDRHTEPGYHGTSSSQGPPKDDFSSDEARRRRDEARRQEQAKERKAHEDARRHQESEQERAKSEEEPRSHSYGASWWDYFFSDKGRYREREREDKARQEREGAKRKEEQTRDGASSTRSTRPSRWSPEQALAEYKRNAVKFDSIKKFNANANTSFSSVPWPVLENPTNIRPDTITWDAVENFFKSIRLPSEKKELLRQARLLFHPDRLTGRGFFASVSDDTERTVLMDCIVTVSKAVNGLFAPTSHS